MDFAKLEKQLHNHMPLIGAGQRRKAAEALAADGSAEAVPLLVSALDDKDEQARGTARNGLLALRDRAAIDRLCELWQRDRAAAPAASLREKKYIASQPVKLRVLTSLFVGQPATDPEAVPLLLESLKDTDAQILSLANDTLRGLRERDSVAALCNLAIEDPKGVAARICIETKKRPADPEQAALLLFVTGQLDAYFQEDDDFHNLRVAYERATPAAQALVMEVVRGGDRRCLGFFGRRKPLHECTEREIELAMEAGLRHKDWPRLFRAFQEMPLKYGFPLIEEFRKSGWQPEQEDLRSLFRAVLEESKGEAMPKVEKPKDTSAVFERWLQEGRTGEYSKLSEAELVQRLAQATPPEGVRIAAALSTKTTAGSASAQTVEKSEHWLVRLAGHATGLCADITRDKTEDANYWINELVRSSGALEFWPVKATPADLEKLGAAPREAFLGKFGAVRRVLRLLLAQRVTAAEIGEVEEVIFDAGEFTEA